MMSDEPNRKIIIVSFLLRISVAFAFLYAGIASFVEPYAWTGYLPAFLQHLFPANLLLEGLAVAQILLALWLLWGRALSYAASIAALMLIGIIVFNIGAFDIVFRDVAILFSAFALIAIGIKSRERGENRGDQ